MKTLKLGNAGEEISVGKIVCVGRNYSDHAKELGSELPTEPLIFLKTATCLAFSGEEVIHPDYSEELHHEIELVLLIGESVKNASIEEADEVIIGYAVGLDMTLRDIQRKESAKGVPWTISKVFDTSAFISDFKSRTEYNLKQKERIFCKVNGKIRQSETLDKMIFSPADLVQYISEKMTLEKGDLIFTGTPAGVGKVERGDLITGGIEHIGEIETKIV